MTNTALITNPPSLNGLTADIHITRRGSDWLWAVFTMFSVASFVFLGLGFRRPASNRIFHYITTAITITAAVAYFTLASDLGFTVTQVEYIRGGKVAGNLRQVFYVRYIDWFITTPLLLLDLLLTAALPWPSILFTLFMNEVMIITGLVGAIIPSVYKWAFFAFGCLAFLYVVKVLLLDARKHAAAVSPDVGRAYNLGGIWLVGLWFLYPIAWGVAEGGNVITPDSEAVFYGILDVLAKIGFGAILLWSHRNIDPAILGLRLRMPGDPIGHHSYGAPGEHTEKHHGHHNGNGLSSNNGVTAGNGVIGTNGHNNGFHNTATTGTTAGTAGHTTAAV